MPPTQGIFDRERAPALKRGVNMSPFCLQYPAGISRVQPLSSCLRPGHMEVECQVEITFISYIAAVGIHET